MSQVEIQVQVEGTEPKILVQSKKLILLSELFAIGFHSYNEVTS